MLSSPGPPNAMGIPSTREARMALAGALVLGALVGLAFFSALPLASTVAHYSVTVPRPAAVAQPTPWSRPVPRPPGPFSLGPLSTYIQRAHWGQAVGPLSSSMGRDAAAPAHSWVLPRSCPILGPHTYQRVKQAELGMHVILLPGVEWIQGSGPSKIPLPPSCHGRTIGATWQSAAHRDTWGT